MPDLTYRQQKIQEKRKQTPFRDFVMEIVSWRPLTFYKNQGFTSKYPLSERVQHLVSHKVFLEGDNIVQGESPTDPDFFVALQTLLQKTPLSPTIISSESENAIYSDQTLISANIYLSSVIVDSKNILYSLGVKIGSENVVSSCAILQSENIYASTSVSESYEVFYSHTIHNSSHIWRCNNLIGCHFCYKCHDLENKSYCINNQQFSKEQYINTIDTLLSLDRYQEEIHQHKSQNINCNEVIGAGCINCNELTDAYICKNISFGRNLFLADDKDVVEHVYDCFGVGGSSFASANHLYGIMGGGSAEHIYCSANVPFSNYTFYSYALENCSFCL